MTQPLFKSGALPFLGAGGITLGVVQDGTSVNTFDYTGITVPAGTKALVLYLDIQAAAGGAGITSATWDNGGTNQAMTNWNDTIASGGSGNAQTVYTIVLAPGNATITTGAKTLHLVFNGGPYNVSMCAVAYANANNASHEESAFPNTGNANAASGNAHISTPSNIGDMVAMVTGTSFESLSPDPNIIFNDTWAAGVDQACASQIKATTTSTTLNASGAGHQWGSASIVIAAPPTNPATLYSGAPATAANVNTSGSITPAANALLIGILAKQYTSTYSGNHFAFAGCSLTWNRVTEFAFGTGTSARVLVVFSALTGSSPGSGTVTATDSSGLTENGTKPSMQILQVIGTDQAAPIGSVVTNSTTGTTLALGSIGSVVAGDLPFFIATGQDSDTEPYTATPWSWSAINRAFASDETFATSYVNPAQIDESPTLTWSTTFLTAMVGFIIKAPFAAASAGTFRRTRSLLGTRIGSRQAGG